ncbi:PTS fructose transporter subunit IIC [Metabacillus sediminilitoris]|uniref:PTS fructose transporter subunit IIC n=1 Tax=Metabacillus sediminilitoris TaxID=2567941 RepID=A0A4S4C2U6_9BACI|nr:PTS fructose transporter subunit IIC [Metabacillus sediminilitoris]QGQ48263.1 PTS fructose transporter subunit IIC [Metabacillus sediminilitoris]THF81379.1 PTS fructose transporter subunit IIC [Metabacillus sediminilitoris]
MLKKLQIKKHALTAISFMLPLVVASGLLIAIGNLTGGTVIENYKEAYSIPSALVSLGVLGMGLLAPVIAGAIAYSIADRPGIAPGLLMGLIANAIGAGFLGGMLGGFIVGYFVLFLKNNLKVPKWAEGLMPMMIIPLLSSLVIGLLMFFVLGVPIVWATDGLTSFLTSMQGSMRFVFGAILGGMAAFDFGGPVNKTASLFADGLLLEGIYEPEAVKILASMVPPFGVALSWVMAKAFRKKKYTKSEEDNIKIAFPMGVCMITEGVIPIAAVDIVRVVVSCTTGAAIGGGFSMMWGVGSPVPSGGMFIVPAMNHPLLFCLALLIGSMITGVMLFLWKKEPVENAVDTTEEEEMDLSDIKISF